MPVSKFDKIGVIMSLLAGGVISLQAQSACTKPAMISPAQIEISEASPRIEWTPVADVSHYLVWLESRVPEGRVLMSEEFRTSATYLAPPRPLTSGRATLRIRVTAVCKDNTQATLSTRFRVDASSTCRLAAMPQAESHNGVWRVRWKALQSAQRYEIRVHSGEDGKPVSILESRGTAAELGRLEAGAWLLAVQPECKGLKGASSWLGVGVN